MGGRPFSDEEQRRLCLRLCLDIGHSELRQFSLTRAFNSAGSGNQNAARTRSVPPASSALMKPVVTLVSRQVHPRFAALRNWEDDQAWVSGRQVGSQSK